MVPLFSLVDLSSCQNCQPLSHTPLPPFIVFPKWVCHHDGWPSSSRWVPLCPIFLIKWDPLHTPEMTPLELTPASRFLFGRWIFPRHYITPEAISCGDRFELCLFEPFIIVQYLLMVSSDYALFEPFVIVRYNLGGSDLHGPWSWAKLWFMDHTSFYLSFSKNSNVILFSFSFNFWKEKKRKEKSDYELLWES